MTVITSGVWPIDPTVTTGTELATYLNELVQAVNSSQSSASRPAMVVKGGVWAKTKGATDIDLMFFDGTTDFVIGSVVGGVAKFGGSTFNFGATAAKPTTPAPVKGDIFYDTTLSRIEIYDGGAWKSSGSLHYDGTKAYVAGDLVLDPTTGKYSIANKATTGAVQVAADWSLFSAEKFARLDKTQAFTKGQSGAVVAIPYAATMAPDLSAANNFSIAMTGNATLANPTNIVAGQSGAITITQDGTGSRTLAFGNAWKFTAGKAPSLTTAAGSVDVLVYYVESTTRITAKLIGDSK